MNRDELRRLQKAARDNNKTKLAEWADMYERQVALSVEKHYEKCYKEITQTTVDNFITAVAYTLVFSEETQLNIDTLPSFMSDMMATIDMYRTGEYKPEEYVNILKENGIVIDCYDYSRLYKDHIARLESSRNKYEEKCNELIKLIEEYHNKLEELNKGSE